MSKNRKYFILSEMILGTMVLVLAVFMLNERRGDSLGRVSVIVRDSDDGRWAAFRYGLEMAAEDRNLDLVIVGTESVLTLEEETALIENEIGNGADAVIVQPVYTKGAEEMLMKIDRKLPVILVEGPASKDEGTSQLPVVSVDNYAVGKALAEELLRDYGGNLKGRTLGILSETTDSPASSRRVDGFRETLADSEAELKWFVAGSFEEGGADYLEVQPKVDFIAALDDCSLRTAGEHSAAGELQGAVVYGIGHSTQSAYYLDHGAVECMIAPDSFNMGYQSMCELANRLQNLFYRAESKTMSYTVIRKEDLFLKENQELLFTMSQ